MMKTLLTLLVIAMTAITASARDVVVLKDGRQIEGDIVREIDGNIWMYVYFGDLKKQEFFAAVSIEKVKRDATVDEADRASDPAEKAARPGVPKGMVITLEGMVGVEMAAQKLEELIPMIEDEIGEGGILVLKINSGGGFLAEVQLLSDVIENELKPKFEVVGWIESAISAAAMTAITMERLYFMPEGNLGAATGWSGNLVAVKGRNLEEVFYRMEQISARGKRDARIIHAMQGRPDRDVPLSATIDRKTGEVTWYQDEDSGQILVNRAGDILTFNSDMARDLRFSEGTARDLDELTREMGYDEIDWVGEWRNDLIFPVSKAENDNRRWREFIDQNNAGLAVAAQKYRMYLNAANGNQGDNRGKLVNKARGFLRSIKRYATESPKLVTVVLGIPWDQFDGWYEQQVETLRDLMD